MKQIKGYDIPLTGAPLQIPDAPVRAVVTPSLGLTATAYLEVDLDAGGQPVDGAVVLVQVLPVEQGISDASTWLAATADGRLHLFKVADAGNAS